MTIETCVENFFGAVLKALEASTPKRRPRDDLRPQILAGIHDEIRLKTRLRRRWQITRDPALKAEVNSVTRRLEWRNDQWSATLESLDPEDQSLWRMTKRVVKVRTPHPLVTPGVSLSQTLRKPKPLPTIWSLFQPVTDPSFQAVIEMVDAALRSYFLTPANEPKLITPE
jgi:hypothetical protein